MADGHLDITPEALLSHYKGAAVGDSIVEITTTAPSYPLAANTPTPCAKAFLAVQADVQGQTLQLQIVEYNGDLNALNTANLEPDDQIGSLTPAAPAQPSRQASASIQNLTNQQSL